MQRRSLSARVLAPCLVLLVACAGGDPDAAESEDADLTRFRGARVERIDNTLEDVDAVGYDVSVELTEAARGRERIVVDARETFVATRALRELALDYTGEAPHRVALVLSSGTERALAARSDGGKLRVDLGATIPKGRAFTVRVVVSNALVQGTGRDRNAIGTFGGFVAQDTSEGRRMLSTLNWPKLGRTWIPLRDHPADGAMFALRATFPKRFTVVGNGKLVSTRQSGESKVWEYENLVPIPSYDFHVAAYDGWKETDVAAPSGKHVHTWVYGADQPTSSVMLGELPKALAFYEKLVGPFRFEQAGFLEEPIWAGGMENAGVVSLDETLFRTPQASRTTAFHELAHHWSGNLVRIRRWNDFWLSEGFTDYLSHRFVEENDGAAASSKEWGVALGRATGSDGAFALRPGDAAEFDPVRFMNASAIPYDKGAWVLRTLEGIVGRPALDAFLHGWFARHAFEAVTTEQWEAELSSETGRDLSGFFSGFVHGTGHPELRVTWTATAAGGTRIALDQTQAGAAFVVPVTLELSGASGGAPTLATIDLRDKHVEKEVPQTVRRAIVDPKGVLYGLVACSSDDPCRTGTSCRAGFCRAF